MEAIRKIIAQNSKEISWSHNFKGPHEYFLLGKELRKILVSNRVAQEHLKLSQEQFSVYSSLEVFKLIEFAFENKSK